MCHDNKVESNLIKSLINIKEVVVMAQAGVLCVFAAPLDEVGVLHPYGETLLPDVDGLQHPSMPQLG